MKRKAKRDLLLTFYEQIQPPPKPKVRYYELLARFAQALKMATLKH